MLAGARRGLGRTFAQAEADYATVANAIAAFEPVLMTVDPRQAAEARRLCGAGVDVVELPLDDSWARDSGPIFVRDDGGRAGVQFGFNGWGEKYVPYDEDAQLAGACSPAAGRGAPRRRPLVLEGGSISVDGAGTLVTTEQCLFEQHRNPRLSREQIEAELREQLGAERVVWLGLGLVEDRDTDGHVDNICAFIAPGRAVLQTVPTRRTRTSRTARRTCAGARRGDRGDRAAVAAVPPVTRDRTRRRPVHELLRLQRRADRPRPRRGGPTTTALGADRVSCSRGARRWR